MSKKDINAEPQIEESAIFENGEADNDTASLSVDEGVNSPEEEVLPQSEIQPLPEDGSQATDDDSPQSEKKEPRRRRTTAKKASAEEVTTPTPEAEESIDASPSQEEQPDRSPRTAGRRARRSNAVVSIDAERSVQTPDDKTQSDLLDLVESLKSHRILTGTIQGVERSEENPDLSYAVVYHGDFKVVIPAEETVEPPTDFRDRSPGDVMHYLVTKRLGAEIDFIVKGVEPEAGIAAASRLEAMAAKRREYYYGTDRAGNNLLYEGICAEARVVSVIRAGIFVDIFGVETYIPLRELSYQRWMDAASHYQAGQRVLVKILSIDREGRQHIRVTASVKQAGENPYEKALRRYTVGSRYVGTVSMVDTNGVFVSLDGGIDCLCTYPKRGRPPRGSRVTVRILGINKESNRIWGAITHMTTR